MSKERDILILKGEIMMIHIMIENLERAFVWEEDDCGHAYWDGVYENLNRRVCQLEEQLKNMELTNV